MNNCILIDSYNRYLQYLNKFQKIAFCLLVCNRLRPTIIEHDKRYHSNLANDIDNVIKKIWKYLYEYNVDIDELRLRLEHITPTAEDVFTTLTSYVLDVCCIINYIIEFISTDNESVLSDICVLIYDSIFRYIEDTCHVSFLTFNALELYVEKSDFIRIEHLRQLRDFKILIMNSNFDKKYIEQIIDSHSNENCLGSIRDISD